MWWEVPHRPLVHEPERDRIRKHRLQLGPCRPLRLHRTTVLSETC